MTDPTDTEARDQLAQAFAVHLAVHLGGNVSTAVDSLALRLANVAIHAGWRRSPVPLVEYVADDTCSRPMRVDGPGHSWSFDGDDPYIVCGGCDEMRDAINGRVIRPGRKSS